MSEAASTEREYNWPEGFTEPPVVLLVDDEANILNSLRRTLRPKGYKVLIATGGAEALEILAAEPVDLIMSDMRMPIMDGAQLLAEVRQKWPDAMRLLLTGYADMESTVNAVNRGGIFRYISKPWDDEELMDILHQALVIRGMTREKIRLQALTKKQNAELQNMNASLEHKVQERTAELQGSNQELTLAHEKLKKSFFTSVQVFSNLIELRAGPLAGHGRRVADISKRIAQTLGMSPNEIQQVLLGGLLHDLGKLSFSDDLLSKPQGKLTGDELGQMRKHPANGANAISSISELRAVVEMIRCHHERFDGSGYPAGLIGHDIPLGARIVALASDYDDALSGNLFGRKATIEEAVDYIGKCSGLRYDPVVVDAFLGLNGRETSGAPKELVIRSGDLAAGQKLARDLRSPSGTLLLAVDYVLTDTLIRQLQTLEEREKATLVFHISI